MSTINFKVESEIKTELETQARLRNLTLSEYLRIMVLENLGIKPKAQNPFLALAGVLTNNEAKDMLKNITKSRKNKSQDYWKSLTNKLS